MGNDERIEAKRAELMEYFKYLPEEKLHVASDLISQAAFLAVALEDLAEVISEEGMTEEYVNGRDQSGRKISSNAKMYSSLIGKYNTIVTRLLKIVPPKPDTTKRDREILRKIEEKECEQQDKYAEAVNKAFHDALIRGEVDYANYSEFIEEWCANNPYEKFASQE